MSLAALGIVSVSNFSRSGGGDFSVAVRSLTDLVRVGSAPGPQIVVVQRSPEIPAGSLSVLESVCPTLLRPFCVPV